MRTGRKMRLSSRELAKARLFNCRKAERSPANAIKRRPKLMVTEDGKVIITTRRNMEPRPKKVFRFVV